MNKKVTANTTTRVDRTKKRLVNAAGKPYETLLIQYDNSADGYDEDQIDDSRDQYGANVITKQKKASVFRRLWEAFINPFTVVLFVLAGLSLVTDVIAASPGEKDPTAVIIVLTMVFVSGMLRFVQELRSNNAAERLGEMVETTVAVTRRYETDESDDPISEKREIPLDEIVVGDFIHLAAGDIIPADLRILQAKVLFVSQSSLTGESESVEKFGAPIVGKRLNPLDLNNLAFMGSTVVSGSATALALAVGDDTVLGGIAGQLQEKMPPTSFEKGVSSISWLLIRFMLVMVPVVLFVNGFTKGDWLEAFLFALSIAVGLTPEMLPMIVSANLAKGASSMSKKKVIVKEINAIQNFGAMDILCTDKTGTLTQDKIILEYHLDIHGNNDPRVLRHAFLNSYYQTGLKNLMDVSIIQRAREENVVENESAYVKLDEIPFDFSRRRMSVVVSDFYGKSQMITKGAIEEMLSISAYVEYSGNIEPITDAIRNEVLETCNKFNDDGFRVLGVAQKTNPSPIGSFSVTDESDMVLIGYLAFLDPPKESAATAIASLHEYGVNVKVLTGDNDAVTKSVCKQVGLSADKILLGADVEDMDEAQLKIAVEETDVFAKLSPGQKARVVTALRDNGHTVGYMGDGINDSAAMRASDVGLSVDTAVDIAKESAKMILTEKDLMVLKNGVIEGRKIYANIIKYIKMTASSNFGNMFSVLVACAFLPFLPMLPIQLLLLNLIYDISCIAIPWDNVDEDFLAIPRKWDASSIGKFMAWIGPTSSVFDITTYALMFFVICPAVIGVSGSALDFRAGALSGDALRFIALFQAGWFVESMWSQTLVIHMIRTPKVPFIRSRASLPVVLLTFTGIAVLTIIPFTPLGTVIGLTALPPIYFAWLALTIVLYMALATLFKMIFVRRYGELL
ncbi:MAG: magnesium-translocating P-type ATPase [Oscillospiraceae bacterium]|jgi:Mg2+-importing ATPase|nr:magnesium-translocating P-type ATPase [Oscillospiraceae bacterium]